MSAYFCVIIEAPDGRWRIISEAAGKNLKETLRRVRPGDAVRWIKDRAEYMEYIQTHVPFKPN